MKDKFILVSAYSCEPNRGSEPGVGWDYVSEMSKNYRLLVLTRDDKREILEEQKLENVDFQYIKLPFFKKNKKYGPLAFFHYYLWQVWLFFYVKRHINLEKVLFIHHITFVNSWTPSFLVFFKKKFVWGPIGEHPQIPINYFFNIPFKYFLIDRFRVIVRKVFKSLDVFLNFTKRKATTIICINKELSKSYPKKKTKVHPAISINASEFQRFISKTKKSDNTFNIFWAGNIVYWKGIDLVIDTFNIFSNDNNNVKLNIIGDGGELERIKKKASHNSKIEFLGKLRQDELFPFINSQDLFFYPSFEGGGMITLEAMAIGKPILCLNFGGPGEMTINNYNGFSIDYTNYSSAIENFVDALSFYSKNREFLYKHGDNSIQLVEKKFSLDSKINFFKNIYAEL